jgi:hypothetical protein
MPRMLIGSTPRQTEVGPDPVRIEVADPDRVETKVRSRQHHMGGDDGRVDVRGVLAVERALPAVRVVRADDQREWGSIHPGG